MAFHLPRTQHACPKPTVYKPFCTTCLEDSPHDEIFEIEDRLAGDLYFVAEDIITLADLLYNFIKPAVKRYLEICGGRDDIRCWTAAAESRAIDKKEILDWSVKTSHLVKFYIDPNRQEVYDRLKYQLEWVGVLDVRYFDSDYFKTQFRIRQRNNDRATRNDSSNIPAGRRED